MGSLRWIGKEAEDKRRTLLLPGPAACSWPHSGWHSAPFHLSLRWSRGGKRQETRKKIDKKTEEGRTVLLPGPAAGSWSHSGCHLSPLHLSLRVSLGGTRHGTHTHKKIGKEAEARRTVLLLGSAAGSRPHNGRHFAPFHLSQRWSQGSTR